MNLPFQVVYSLLSLKFAKLLYLCKTDCSLNIYISFRLTLTVEAQSRSYRDEFC